MPTLSTYHVKRYGWIRDLPDQRDLMYAAPIPPLALPTKTDLRTEMPQVYDQGDLGSCTANAIGAAVQVARRKEKRQDFIPSRLAIYYDERVIERTVDQDSGAQLRDGMKVVARVGVCAEASSPPESYDWSYDISKFKDKPPEPCYDFAKDNQVIVYRRVPQLLSQMKGCLASGYPFVFGFSVYQSFESPEVARTGDANLPGPKEEMLGGHAVLAVGYDDASQRFLVRNSWGSSWGQQGYFTLPYAYLSEPHLSSDFWTVRQTE